MGNSEAAAETVPAPWGWRVPKGLSLLLRLVPAIYICICCVALPIALIAPLAGTWLSYHQRTAPLWRPLGFQAESDGVVWRVAAVWGEEARAAGIVPGMAVSAVNYHPLSPDRLDAAWFGSGDGARVDLTLGPRPGVQRRLVRRSAVAARVYTGSGFSESSAKWVGRVAGLVPMLCMVPAAVLLFGRRQNPVAAVISLAFLLIAATMSAAEPSWWALGLGSFWSLVGDIGWALLMIGLATFPSGRVEPRWTLGLIAAACLWPLLLRLPNVPDGGYNLSLITLLALCSAAQASRYRSAALAERQQLRWSLFGFSVGAGLLAIAGAALTWWDVLAALDARWLVWRYAIIYPLIDAAIGLFALGLLISLARYRLYAIDTVISRSVVYGALTVMLLAVFAGSEKLVELLGEEYFRGSLGVLAGVFGAVVAAVTLAPLHHRLRHWAERRFRKPLIRLRDALPLLLADLRETAGLEQIATAVLDAIAAGVHASRAALLVGDRLQDARGISAQQVEEWRATWKPPAASALDRARGEDLFPLRVPLQADGHGRVGWLLIGPRPDASGYGRDERETIAAIADPIARGVEVVRLREAREKVQESRLAAVEQALALALNIAKRPKTPQPEPGA